GLAERVVVFVGEGAGDGEFERREEIRDLEGWWCHVDADSEEVVMKTGTAVEGDEEEGTEVGKEVAQPEGTQGPTDSSVLATPTHADTDSATEDSKKRKRRSLTPEVHEDIVNKKLKQLDVDEKVHLKEDFQEQGVNGNEDTVMEEVAADVADTHVDAKVLPMATSDDVMDITNHETVAVEGNTAVPAMLDTTMEQDRAPAGDEEAAAPEKQSMASTRDRASSTRDNRYKDLLPQKLEKGKTQATVLSADDATVQPSLHPATAALYIRELIRPINPNDLRDHLIALATPANASPDADLLSEFHVDTLRTHVFALFTNVAAAVRLRSALHNRVWPVDPTRKPLWCDFVPEEKVKEWIEVELSSSSNRTSQVK
ncbi:hypothetical protein LTR28_001836, partial [Elasticomyces elasticus]